MPTFSPDRLQSVLLALLPASVRKLAVAYSGGLDSSVLLAALATLKAEGGFDLRAFYVDHQLHPASSSWGEQCVEAASKLDVECLVLKVSVDVGAEGVEAGARNARYGAIRPLIYPEEALVTAHHADDQLETMLLALVRGAGPAGLAASPQLQRFGAGHLLRPLLTFTRQDLECWAREQRLDWIEDPANQNIGFDRNFLRQHVTRVLKQRWPSIATSAVRASGHLSEATQLLENLASADLRDVAVAACLDVHALQQLSGARRRNVLRYWLKNAGVRAPSTRKLASIEHDLIAAPSDRIITIAIEDALLRRHRNLLYCDTTPAAFTASVLEWNTQGPLELPAGLGTLSLVKGKGAGVACQKLPQTLAVRFRQGGERIRISSNTPRRPLKKLLQEGNVLPWWRERLPLIYAAEALVAVGDLWVDVAFAAQDAEPSWSIVWSGKPLIEAISR